MVKVKTISRDESEWTRERNTDLMKVHKNLDPVLHPFERAREYTRALNAVKLEKIFAKPFIASLDGHKDAVYCLSRHPKSISTLLSASGDGEVKIWNVSFNTCTWTFKAHKGIVRGAVFCPEGDKFLTCGNDKIVKLWNFDPSINVIKEFPSAHEQNFEEDVEPITTYLGEHMFTGIDHQRFSSVFATSSTELLVWDRERSKPIKTFSWGTDTVTSVKFNPVETDILASTATDRSVCFYDLRGKTAVRKLVMQMKCNTLSWNPMEAFHFTLANEDSCLYSFDMRKLDSALVVHKDHISAVLDVDYSPTGKEFVSASYDHTIRIFGANQVRSRDIYHGKRMQRLFAVRYSGDGRFIFCGSDDTNIRVWKSDASAPIKPLLPREKAALNYSNKLKQKFKYAPEVKRILRHHHLPKFIFKKNKVRHIQRMSQNRKLKNVLKYAKPGTINVKPEKKKKIVEQLA